MKGNLLKLTPIILLNLFSCDFSNNILYPGAYHKKYHLTTCRLLKNYLTLTNEVIGNEEIAYYQSPKGDQGTVIFFHGNFDTACDASQHKNYPNNIEAIFYEYPNYYYNSKLQQADINQEKIITNAKAFFESSLPTLKKPIFIHGQSLGTGIATYLAAHYPNDIAGLILTSPYTSMSEVASSKVGVGNFLMNDNKWIASEWALKVKAPVTIIHGDNDDLIPLDFSLWQSTYFANTKVKIYIKSGVGHNDITDEKEVKNSINDVLGI